MNKLKITLLLSYICIASISAAMITPALSTIETSFHILHGSVEWLVSIFLLGYVIGQLIYSPLANRYNPLNALRLGLIINLFGLILCLFASYHYYFDLLLLGRFVSALGAASGLACTFMLIHAYLDEHQSKAALAFTIVAFTLGIGLAVFFGGILTQYISWQSCFIVLFIHGLIMLFCTWCFPHIPHLAKPIKLMSLLHDYKIALSSRELIVYSLVVGFCSAFGYGFSAAAPLIAHYLLGLSPSEYGMWNIINMVGMCASGFVSHSMMRKYEAKHIIIFAMFACFLGIISLTILFLSAEHNSLWFFCSTSWLYLFSGMLFPSASFYASKAISCRASASSMMSFLNMGSAMVAVIIMGYLPFNNLLAFILILFAFLAMITLGLIYNAFKTRGIQSKNLATKLN